MIPFIGAVVAESVSGRQAGASAARIAGIASSAKFA
jgi:hypothetical protein